jgi:hypothetical protein
VERRGFRLLSGVPVNTVFLIIRFLESQKKSYLCTKKCIMVIEVKEITPENINELLGKMKKSRKQTVAKHFGKLKRGLDGMKYQRAIRNEWS